jgi:hypothetical protein
MLFIAANATFPRGVLFSTARQGPKWSEQAKPGDVVDLMVTESRKHIGRATIVATKLTTFKDACESAAADKNHALTPGMDDSEAAQALAQGLRAAYPHDLKPGEPFTVVTMMAHNPE